MTFVILAIIHGHNSQGLKTLQQIIQAQHNMEHHR